MKLASILLICYSLAASAQQPAKPIGPPPVNASTGSYYPLSAESRSQIRDFQYRWAQLEIQNQKLLLQVEQNREKQRDLVDGEKRVAWNEATEKHIDLGLFELDSDEVTFIPKKKAQ